MTEQKTYATPIVFVKLFANRAGYTFLSILFEKPNNTLGELLSVAHRSEHNPIRLVSSTSIETSHIKWDEASGDVVEICIKPTVTPIH